MADKRQLELHINNTHKKKKPYLCYMCGYASAVKHSLVVHMRRHTGTEDDIYKILHLLIMSCLYSGEKPYECEKCEYKAADHNALRRHRMKHSGVRNYKCNHCSYTCIQASTYKVHIKTKHPGIHILMNMYIKSYIPINNELGFFYNYYILPLSQGLYARC